MTKVALVDADGRVETLWATPVGEDLYRLENTPFFAYGYSWLDVVHAEFSSSTGFPTATRPVQKSGHRTVRILAEIEQLPEPVLAKLAELGCTYEGAYSRLICVDIPPAIDLRRVIQLLLETNCRWEHADPTYEEFHGRQSGAP